MEDLAEILALRLRQMRHERGWSQEELAAKAEVSSRYIGYIERREGSPTVTVLGRLADAFGVDACALITPLVPRRGGRHSKRAS